MRLIGFIWAFFAILFICLGWFHIRAANRNIVPFEIKAKDSVNKIMGIDIHTGFNNFIKDLNCYVEANNIANRRQNILTAIGYFSASLIAILSFLLTIDKTADFLNRIFKC